MPVNQNSAAGEVKRYFPQCPLYGGETGEDFWQINRFDHATPLEVDNWIYEQRRREYHENQIQRLLGYDLGYTRKLATDFLAKESSDIRKYVW